ncbi:MerR-family transcriptional regulator [Roseobacter sp. SK209-2-6]|uniref:MerR family DNA-binding transcriptional regulator n=1 Tax=Roseobacter sp. SK209-2-6 TaxID=388739 RepID=UPI0000F3C7BC|nr:MerR-family transcriptional regulator [Roseobacter sp. SK209-2-6]
MKLLDISVFSELSGVSPSILRYYEEIGLIHSVARKELRLQFDTQVTTQHALISLGKMAGFSLEKIKGMLAKDGTPQ